LDCQDFENEGNGEKSAFTPKSVMSEHHANKKDKRKRRPPGILQFTPTKDMPDTLYYQSFTAAHLGGVIHLVDICDNSVSKSNQQPSKSSREVGPTFRPQLGTHLMATKISNATSEKTQRRNSSPFQNSRNQIRKKMPISRHGNGNKSSGPNLLKNNKQKRNKTPREKVRLQERVGNRGSNVNNIRRMDSAPTNIEYVDTAGGDTATEMDFFDAKTRKLWNQCKNKASQKERKIETLLVN
jgi:hypothetical protein